MSKPVIYVDQKTLARVKQLKHGECLMASVSGVSQGSWNVPLYVASDDCKAWPKCGCPHEYECIRSQRGER